MFYSMEKIQSCREFKNWFTIKYRKVSKTIYECLFFGCPQLKIKI